VARVEVIETHFAWVFLTARHAYKLKKPLHRARMDYRTLGSRARGCREEIRLNRRLAPAVYLAAVPLSTDRRGRLHLGRGERIEDWLVKMRRLPAASMLDRTLARRPLRKAEIDGLMGILERFFASAPSRPLRGADYVVRLRRQVHANRRLLSRHGTRTRAAIEAVARAQLEFLEAELSRADLAARAAHLVEGHGDLRPEHVCLAPPISVIDCLEFDRALRRLDPLEELAFLALEIERLGHGALARELMRRSRRVADAQVPDAVLHFYMSHRAATRAKLSAWHIGDPQFPNPRPWAARTRSYLSDALRHSRGALRLVRRSSPSAMRRPALEQRRHRNAARHPDHRLTQQGRDRQHLEPLRP
jgi:aminoglycoside phosphotransferase family enzyme